MLNIDVPLHIDGRGRTATTDHDRHVLDMIELMLFTNPGERVNRPDFGGGVRALLFSGNGSELAAALKFTIQSNLQRWLVNSIDIRDLAVSTDESTIRIELQYFCRKTNTERTATLQRGI